MTNESALRLLLGSLEGARMPTSFPDKPFVGFLGDENTLAVIRGDDRLLCKMTEASYRFRQAILVLFAGSLSALLWFTFDNPAARLPLPVSILVWTLTLICWFVLVRNLFGTPRLELRYGTGEIWLFKWRSAEPWKKFQKNEMRAFEISKQTYQYKSAESVNYLLSLLTVDGERVRLCASTDEQLIRSLAGDFEKITGRKLEIS